MRRNFMIQFRYYSSHCLALALLGLLLGGCRQGGQSQQGHLIGAAYAPATSHASWKKTNAQLRRSGVHQGYVDIYANEPAAKVKAQGGEYPPGSIIVKEVYADGGGQAGPLSQVYAMEKRQRGFAPNSNDWEWLVTDAKGKILQAGDSASLNGRSCVMCHTVK